MRAPRSRLSLLGTLTLACWPASADAQPVGSEFRVNTYTTSGQSQPSIASDASGNFVVVWESFGQDGFFSGIFGQRYDSMGGALGSEFRVNSYTPQYQDAPSVASDSSGDFVVVWQSGYGQDGHYYGIFGQRYDSAGVRLGAEFRVNSYTPQNQWYPSVASAASGNFVVVWGSGDQDGSVYGIFGQRYDSAGVRLGGEFRVNSYTTNLQRAPSVGSDASGNFVVVWHSRDQDGDDEGVFGQRYDSEGVAQGGEFRVNSYTTNRQAYPSVGSDPSGNFVVVWTSYTQDGSGSGVFGQRYDSEGVAQGNEFRVNSYTMGQQWSASVATDAGGNFVVVRGGQGRGDGYGIFAQRYDSGGVALGDEFRINSYTTGSQIGPSVTSDAGGNFVVAWFGPGQGDSLGVFGRRYNFAGQTITVVRPNTNVKWLIGSVKEIRWTHNLGVNSTFRIELDRNDDGTYEELIAADAPADSPTIGSFAWTVTRPPSGRARVRVSWTDDLAVSDASDMTFRIKLEG